MLWAMGAILLHFQAVPQAVVPAASQAAAQAAQAQALVTEKVTLADASPVSDGNGVTAFEPGRLALTPAIPLGAAAVAAPSSPAIIRLNPAPRKPEAAGRITGGAQKLWLGLSIAQHSAAAFDAWSTRRAITRGGAQELNPMLKPFAGNSSIYAATQVAPTLLDLLGRRMMTSRHPLLRRTWWLPQVLGTAASVASGAHNLRVR
jgi:hypothetical protein